MDALTVLKREHTRIEQLFSEFDSLPDGACKGRQALMREIDDTFRRHLRLEEALVYQRLATAAGYQLQDRVVGLHSTQEHAMAIRLLDEISRTECHDVMYVPRVLVLRDLIARHIREEEDVIFELVRTEVGANGTISVVTGVA